MFVCYLNYLPCEFDSKNIVFLFHTSNPLNFFHPHRVRIEDVLMYFYSEDSFALKKGT